MYDLTLPMKWKQALNRQGDEIIDTLLHLKLANFRSFSMFIALLANKY